MSKPTFMYHHEHPQGEIFDADEVSLVALEAEGWVDHPDKVKKHFTALQEGPEPEPGEQKKATRRQSGRQKR